jgi:hypothetical protein
VIKERKYGGEEPVLMYRNAKEGKRVTVGRRNSGVENLYLRK